MITRKEQIQQASTLVITGSLTQSGNPLYISTHPTEREPFIFFGYINFRKERAEDSYVLNKVKVLDVVYPWK